MKKTIRRWLSRLRCLFGHAWKRTDIFHIQYQKNGYDYDEYYVVACSRCGKRQARVKIDQHVMEPEHA